MSSETTNTTLNDLIPLIVAEALFVASERSIMRNLVRNFAIPDGAGKSIVVPSYPIQTAAAVNEGTDLTNTAVSSDGVTLALGEVGIMTTVTDMAVSSASSNVVADIGRLFGEAIARKMDQDLTALFAGFSTVVGGNTTAATAALFFSAIAKLKAKGVPGDALFAVVNPLVAYDIKSSLTTGFTVGAGLLQNSAMATGYLGMLGGVPVFETSNVVDTSGDSVGGLFHRDALGLALRQDIKIEPQRDASLRATELVATAVYGVGELLDAYGVALSFDSSIA
jgi:N4-gp56 family major capsid protein